MPDPVNMHIGAQIRLGRLERGISQEQLAAALGVSFQQIQKYEKGTNRCAPARLFKIAQILNMPVAAFFPEYGPRPFSPAPLLDAQTLALARAFETIENRAARTAIRQLVVALAAPPAH